jgi:hypothetical protein
MDINKDEQWVLDLFSVAKHTSISPKQIISLWEATFPERELQALRAAIKNLKEKQLVEASAESLSLLVSRPG